MEKIFEKEGLKEKEVAKERGSGAEFPSGTPRGVSGGAAVGGFGQAWYR